MNVVSHHKNICDAVANNELHVNPWFVTGFFEGDGCSTASVYLCDRDTVESKIMISIYSFTCRQPHCIRIGTVLFKDTSLAGALTKE